jgi:hypothetical protein
MMNRRELPIYLYGIAMVLCGCNSSTYSTTPLDARVALLDGGTVRLDTSSPFDMRPSETDALRLELDASLDGGAEGPDSQTQATWRPEGPVDLVLNQALLSADVWFDEIDVDPSSCAFIEGCVDGVGRRRLLRFAVATGNVGAEDLVVGDVSQLANEVEYSPCHRHYHYTDYADYSLLRDDVVVRQGHKQAFCLMDTRPMSGVVRDAVGDRALYNCRFQGISAGWEDVYGSKLDCQWIDITELAEGRYQLNVEINPLGVIKEHRRDNNHGEVTVSVPALNLTQPCARGARTGLKSACGWALEAEVNCEPGKLVRAGAGGCYELGQCFGTTALRACEAQSGACSSGVSLAESDDGCGDNVCPYLEFQCPASGAAKIWSNRQDSDAQAVSVEVDQSKIQLERPCAGDVPTGLDRSCGWDEYRQSFQCIPGRSYRIGCGDIDLVCEKQPACEGDPMFRVCDSTASCFAQEAVGQSDDACGTRCPMTVFRCPISGSVVLRKGSYRANEDLSCELSVVLLPDH